MKRRVADIVMDILVEHDIVDCFAVVGGGAMYLDNALALNDRINKYFNHHEQACAMAAEAYARLSGKMALVCVTSGPGATNAITGVMGAWQDSLPMIVLSGQVRYAISVPKSGLKLRYRGIQEFEIIPSVKNMTKYAVQITDPLSIKQELLKAIDIAMEGRRGPVWLDIPQDIQSAIVEEDELYDYIKEEITYPYVDYNYIVQTLKDAKRPCILAGSGIRSGDVMPEFVSFINELGIPVVGGAWVSDNLYYEHPLYFGNSGNIGPRTGNFILQNADVILSLGNSLGFRQTGFNQEGFAPKSKIIMVDADDAEGKKPGINLYAFVHRPLKMFFEEFPNKKIDVDQQWIEYCNDLKKRFSEFEGIGDLDLNSRVNSYYFWKIFEKYEAEDSIISLGNNTANTAKLQIGVKKKNQRVITNYTCGSMGYDIPAAIGSAVASKKKVICVTGDGSIMMNLQELQTIKHYNLPINIVVFSNDGYAAIRQTSKSFFNGLYIGCTKDTGISFPSFEEVAKTFGFKYIAIKDNASVDDKLNEMFKSDEKVLLEVSQMYDNPVTPKLLSRLDENGEMKSPVLHDMAPFLDKKEIDSLMFKY